MRCFRKLRGSACVATLFLLAAPVLAQPKALEDLKQLFETDPATAFEEAAGMFEGPRRAGDLDGMVAIIEVVAPHAERCTYPKAVDYMVDTAAPLARDSGKWQLLGGMYEARARAWSACGRFSPWGAQLWEVRAAYFAAEAAEAYEKAGTVSEALAQRAREARELAAAAEPGGELERQLNRAYLGPYTPSVLEMLRHACHARDAEAIALSIELTERLAGEPDTNTLGHVLNQIGAMVGLQGGEELIPRIRSLWRPSFSANWLATISGCAKGCTLGWGGRDDPFRETCYWLLDQYNPQSPPLNGGAMGHFVRKLDCFGRSAEALHLLDRMLQFAESLPLEGLASYQLSEYVPPNAPPSTRRRFALLRCRETLSFDTGAAPSTEHPWVPSDFLVGLEEGQKRTLAVESGRLVLEASIRLRDSEARARGAEEALRLFEQGQRQDLADEAQAIAAAARANDPAGQMRFAVSAAHRATVEGRWSQVVLRLGPVVAGWSGEASTTALEAAVLLAQAHSKLSQPAEADAATEQARVLLADLALLPAERANWLTTVASLIRDPKYKVQMLQQAQASATEAKLDILQHGTAQQVAQAALEAGDLAAAKQALTEIVYEQEAKRERLAFDPLLRQQWFADSLGAYRKLLWVAAAEHDARLALECGEKMRSRALLDQLAWRKVDMALALGPELRQRLQMLRDARREAYAKLHRVTGAPSAVATEDQRGAYMPIRGLVEEETPATEGDAEELRSLLESLAREETALESATREMVPSYRLAAQAVLPSPEQLARTVEQDPGLVVLEYTLCDRGAVLVGLGGREQPRVMLLEEDAEALWGRIGRFRELIWERKPEVEAEAQGLYETLVKPMEELVAKARRLWVVADGALQLIPFGSLMDDEGRYLAERVAVAYAPSLSLALSSRGPRATAEASALVVAAPETGAMTVEGDQRGLYMPIRGMYMPIRGLYMPIRAPEGVSSDLTSMALVPLPGAMAEGQAVVGQFTEATLLTGAEATKEALLTQGSRCDVLHIATHGYADPEVPEFSGLLLAGTGEEAYEVLTAQEVYLWDLRARLVTLSACQTGMGRTVEGEGLLGLTRAFIYAGAQDVVCSLWPVSDESTRKLMEAFYANLKTATSVEEALTQAQRTLLADEATKHPFYWAAFVPVRGPQ